MKTLPLVALLAFTYALAHAADWLNYGGDPERTGWQKREKNLTPGNVNELKLLWKRRLENESGLSSLTAPTMLGPIITHRGIKELVFVAGSADNVYAVDADLGRVFWMRHIDTIAVPTPDSKRPCGAGLTAAPVIAGAAVNKVDDDEFSTPLRPIYVLASDGNLHTIRPSDGLDMATAVKFIPPNARAASLNLAARSVYTTTSDGCGGAPNGVWSIDVMGLDAKPHFFPANDARVPANGGVSVGFAGVIYTAFGSTILSLNRATLQLKDYFALPAVPANGNLNMGNVTPVAFTWQGRELIAAAGERGRIFLLDATSLGGDTHRRPLFLSTALANPGNGFTGGLATWEDSSGARWIYAPSRRSITAFRVSGRASKPELTRAWTFGEAPAPIPPVVANGIVFALASGEFTKSTHATLYALDAATGRKLYSSGDAITSSTHSSGLAVANGHVCFGTDDNTLYCFGLPLEI